MLAPRTTRPSLPAPHIHVLHTRPLTLLPLTCCAGSGDLYDIRPPKQPLDPEAHRVRTGKQAVVHAGLCCR